MTSVLKNFKRISSGYPFSLLSDLLVSRPIVIYCDHKSERLSHTNKVRHLFHTWYLFIWFKFRLLASLLMFIVLQNKMQHQPKQKFGTFLHEIILPRK